MFEFSEKSKQLQNKLLAFMDEHIYPNETTYAEQVHNAENRFAPVPLMDELKDKESDIKFEIDQEYIMSPEDLKTVDFIDKMLYAGVRVLKVEGRGRNPEYVKIVTQVYREAVNAYFVGEFTIYL